jgi:NADH-quinone oxidoreductase subunit L
MQNGLVQFYALSMALGFAVLLAFVVFRVTR